MYILAIETSCDETAAAIVKDGVYEISSVIASSKELHEATGGIVPEIAARKQVEFIIPVLDQTLKKFQTYLKEIGEDVSWELLPSKIDKIAVTVGPGLIGSLLIGVETAKTLAAVWNKPLIPVNHLVGHIYANFLKSSSKDSSVDFPALVLVVSGGHTDLVLLRDHGDMEYLGGTVDDAAGEAFDKTARLLGLAKYLGGVQLSNLASTCLDNAAQGTLPRPMLDKNNFDFSFSGLKTSVKKLIESNAFPKDSIACEFETAVVDVLTKKTIKAALKHRVKTIMLGGGVSANKSLRTRMSQEAKEHGFAFSVPPFSLCTDNAVYIASAAYFIGKEKIISNITADPSLSVDSAL